MTESPERRSRLLPAVGLVLSWAMLGLLLGTMAAGRMLPREEGLAGPAKALGFGVITMLVAMVAAVVVVKRAGRGTALRLLAITGPLALLLLGWTLWNVQRALRDDDGTDQGFEDAAPLPARLPALLISWNGLAGVPAARPVPVQAPLGMGMAVPKRGLPALRLYLLPDPELSPPDVPATDSVVFRRAGQDLAIAHAPDWFVPARHEPARGVLLLKVLAVAREWVELEVNGEEGRRMWVERSAVDLRSWPDLLLAAATVSALDPAANPVRVRPFGHAAPLADAQGMPLRALAVEGDWLVVTIAGFADRVPPPGFVRWRDAERLLVSYHMED